MRQFLLICLLFVLLTSEKAECRPDPARDKFAQANTHQRFTPAPTRSNAVPINQFMAVLIFAGAGLFVLRYYSIKNPKGLI